MNSVSDTNIVYGTYKTKRRQKIKVYVQQISQIFLLKKKTFKNKQILKIVKIMIKSEFSTI